MGSDEVTKWYAKLEKGMTKHHDWYYYQNRWPHRVTTGSDAVSKQTLQWNYD